jgi:hypothetical protein
MMVIYCFGEIIHESLTLFAAIHAGYRDVCSYRGGVAVTADMRNRHTVEELQGLTRTRGLSRLRANGLCRCLVVMPLLFISLKHLVARIP